MSNKKQSTILTRPSPPLFFFFKQDLYFHLYDNGIQEIAQSALIIGAEKPGDKNSTIAERKKKRGRKK